MERANLSLYAIFVYIPPLNPSLLLRIEPLPNSTIPMAVKFLTSAPCCTLSIGHDFNGLQCLTVKMSVPYTHYLAVVQNSTPTE